MEKSTEDNYKTDKGKKGLSPEDLEKLQKERESEAQKNLQKI